MKTILMNDQTIHLVQKQAPACVMALGYFDGVHRGHQEVIRTARQEADRRGLPLALMSFRPHPINVLSKGQRIVPHLTTICEKEKRLKEYGVDLFYLVDFTLAFAGLSSKQFVQDYLLALGVVHAVAGFDFSYGAKGAAQLPQIEIDSNGAISVTKVACIDYRGEKISSTAIRQRLLAGAVDEIPYFLGQSYTTKVLWDGHTFHQLEQTMLPVAGIYEVELAVSSHAVRTYLSITETCEIVPLQSYQYLPKGHFTINWRQHIQTAVSSLAIS